MSESISSSRPRFAKVAMPAPSADARAIVLAPHQDDETLGCGGRVIQLRRAGAHVTVVYTTDGRLANSRFMDEEEIARLRKEEAIEACATLGVAKENTVFLPFHDGSLPGREDDLALSLAKVFQEKQPTEIYMPYIKDWHTDHEATSRAARLAIEKFGQPVTGYEFLVWGIYHWPWVSVPHSGFQRKLIIKNTLKECFGLRIRMTFNKALFADIGDVRQQKLEALNKHRSQVSRLVDDPDWLTLSDVADGSWLKWFHRDVEEYLKTEFQ